MSILRELPTFVNRSYKGGRLLRNYLRLPDAADTYQPEDWISSFVEARNPDYVENEGLTQVEVNGTPALLRDLIHPSDFGEGRTEPGVLVKFLDAAERLAIQVHPTKEFALSHFGTPYGKTECWHILDTREENGEPAAIYIGFKEGVTKEQFRKTFETQDIPAMLDCLHRFEVKPGDTVLVTAGTPHAIGAGCFLLEIQEPTDYTMRTETTTVSGRKLTPLQIHYGIGEEAMLDCFLYEKACTREKAEKAYFLKARPDGKQTFLKHLVTYADTPCFRLDELHGNAEFKESCFFTAVITDDGGTLFSDEETHELKRGDKYFIPADTKVTFENAHALLSYPPQRNV